MLENDSRNGTLTQLHERRKQVVRMHRQGLRVMQIAELTGLSYPAVRKTIDRFETGGLAAIVPAARGRRTGMGRRLTVGQEATLRAYICDHLPQQLKIESALWTRAAVMQLIELQCGIELSVRAVDNYVARWGFTPQKSFKRTHVGRTDVGKRWLDQQYPAIEARAKAEFGEIHWGTARELGDVYTGGRGESSSGQVPNSGAAGAGACTRLSMISSRTNQGKMSWIVIAGALNHERIIEFLQALVEDRRKAGKKVFVILDNLGAHRSEPVKTWVAANTKHIEVFHLPTYSSDQAPHRRRNSGVMHSIDSTLLGRAKTMLRTAPGVGGCGYARDAAALVADVELDAAASNLNDIHGEYTAKADSHANPKGIRMASDASELKSTFAKPLEPSMESPTPFTQDARVLDAIAQSDGDPNFVTGLARGLAILLALADKKHHMTISQISRRTGIPRAAARRGLYTLSKLGFVAADEVRGFCLRPTVLTFSHAYLSASPLAMLAQPILDRLGEHVQEACSVAVLDGDEIVYIARSASSKLITSALKVGHRLPAYCTSIGLVMLAHLPPEELSLYLGRAKFYPYTEFTPTTRDEICNILRDVLESGYAFASQQMERRFCSIAVPIMDSSGRFVAGMNVILQGRLLTADKMVARYLRPLRDAALELGTLLCA
jgi:PcaR/PcaU/PobR family beta-ketoadipate pathway transcriptional regulator